MNGNEVTVIEDRQPRSITRTMAEKYSMEPAAFEATLRATVVPGNCSREQFAAFLLVANEYNLNPITKQIYAFPAKGGGITPLVGVDGWLHMANSHPAFDGMEFEDHRENGKLVAITCRVYRKDRAHPMSCTEYMEECRRNTDPWSKSPGRMLRHRAAIQAIRYAFSFSGIIDEEEYAKIESTSTPVKAFTLAAPVDQLPPDGGEQPPVTDASPVLPPAAAHNDATEQAAKSEASGAEAAPPPAQDGDAPAWKIVVDRWKALHPRGTLTERAWADKFKLFVAQRGGQTIKAAKDMTEETIGKLGVVLYEMEEAAATAKASVPAEEVMM